jgi:hypothetical protein
LSAVWKAAKATPSNVEKLLRVTTTSAQVSSVATETEPPPEVVEATGAEDQDDADDGASSKAASASSDRAGSPSASFASFDAVAVAFALAAEPHVTDDVARASYDARNTEMSPASPPPRAHGASGRRGTPHHGASTLHQQHFALSQPLGAWACTRCTFINLTNAEACGMCRAPPEAAALLVAGGDGGRNGSGSNASDDATAGTGSRKRPRSFDGDSGDASAKRPSSSPPESAAAGFVAGSGSEWLAPATSVATDNNPQLCLARERSTFPRRQCITLGWVQSPFYHAGDLHMDAYRAAPEDEAAAASVFQASLFAHPSLGSVALPHTDHLEWWHSLARDGLLTPPLYALLLSELNSIGFASPVSTAWARRFNVLFASFSALGDASQFQLVTREHLQSAFGDADATDDDSDDMSPAENFPFLGAFTPAQAPVHSDAAAATVTSHICN